MTRVVVAPETSTQTVLGKTVSSLQENVVVSNNAISGTLNSIDDYTEFSSDPELQAGHFLALKFTADWDSYTSVKVGVVPSSIGMDLQEIKTDLDKNGVFRITNISTQKIVVESTNGVQTKRQEYSLTGLTLED